MGTLVISLATKRYIEKLFIARTRRERWKAKKQFRIERREEIRRCPQLNAGLSQYITDVSAGIVEPPPLTLDTLCGIMDEIEMGL